MQKPRVRVSAGAKVLWTTVTVVTTHGALQNTTEYLKSNLQQLASGFLPVCTICMYFSTYQVLDFYCKALDKSGFVVPTPGRAGRLGD